MRVKKLVSTMRSRVLAYQSLRPYKRQSSLFSLLASPVIVPLVDFYFFKAQRFRQLCRPPHVPVGVPLELCFEHLLLRESQVDSLDLFVLSIDFF